MTENEVEFVKVLISATVVFVPLFIAFLWAVGAIGKDTYPYGKYECVQSVSNSRGVDTSPSSLTTFETLVVASVVIDSFDGGSSGE
jgi:hypothetical protein